tara:strand:+ start:410 stop:1366 length:957 start_codon:yes stop_codon:yes gene_type:complete
MKDEELKESKLLLEVEIKNLQKFVDPAKKIIEELELKEKLEDEDKKPIPLSEEEKKKLDDSKSEVLLLEKEIKEREDKIKDIDEEVKHREEVRLQIDNALKDLDFEEEEVLKKWDKEKEEEVEYKEPIIKKFLHDFGFCDHIKVKDEEDKVLDVKHIPWDKESVLKDLKLKLDLDKANDLVRRVKDYKHNKKKNELENRLKPLLENNTCFLGVFGEEKIIDSNGDVIHIHYMDRVFKWDKDDLIDFEEKIVKLEEFKVKLDEKEKKEKPIKLRKQEYHRIDELLFEALVEKLEEGRPEKMEEYLKLRKEIKDKHPLED